MSPFFELPAHTLQKTLLQFARALSSKGRLRRLLFTSIVVSRSAVWIPKLIELADVDPTQSPGFGAERDGHQHIVRMSGREQR